MEDSAEVQIQKLREEVAQLREEVESLRDTLTQALDHNSTKKERT